MTEFEGTRLAHAFLNVVRNYFVNNNSSAMSMCISAQKQIRNFNYCNGLSNIKGYIIGNIMGINDVTEREVVASYFIVNASQNIEMKDLLFFNDDLLEIIPGKRLNPAFVDNIIKLHIVLVPHGINWQKMETWLSLRQQHFSEELQTYVYNDMFLRFLPDDTQRSFIRRDFADDIAPMPANKMFIIKQDSDGRPLNGFITFVTLCTKMFYELYLDKHDKDDNKITFKDIINCITTFLNVDLGEYSHAITHNNDAQWFIDFFKHFKDFVKKSKFILIYVIIYCTCTVQWCVKFDFIN